MARTWNNHLATAIEMNFLSTTGDIFFFGGGKRPVLVMMAGSAFHTTVMRKLYHKVCKRTDVAQALPWPFTLAITSF